MEEKESGCLFSERSELWLLETETCFVCAAYSIAKYGMSLCVLGMSQELKPDGIAVNALWPRTGNQTNTFIYYMGKVWRRLTIYRAINRYKSLTINKILIVKFLTTESVKSWCRSPDIVLRMLY